MSGISDPYSGGLEVVPGSAPLRSVANGLWVVTDGNVQFTTLRGQTLGPYAVTAGQIIPFRITHVLSGTTATVVAGTN